MERPEANVVIIGPGNVGCEVLRQIMKNEDPVREIRGTLSGTLGFLTTALEEGKPFSQALKEASALGLTEPDPRDDFNGLDVARKLLIMVRTAGNDCEMNNIRIEPFIDQHYFVKDESPDQFRQHLPDINRVMAEKFRNLKDDGTRLRYVACFRQSFASGIPPILTVGWKEVQKTSILASQGTANAVEIISDTYQKKTPWCLRAPGAGVDITARTVRRNIGDASNAFR